MANSSTADTHPDASATPPSAARRWLALGLYLGVLGLVGLAFATHRALAELGEGSLEFGQRFGAWHGFTDRVTDLTWNGQSLSVSTMTSERPVQAVLDDFAGVCSNGTQTVASDLAARLDATTDLDVKVLQRAFVLRDGVEDREGAVACLAGAGDGGLTGLLERVQAFGRSGDISDIGQLRYAYVRQVPAGSHVIFIAATGPLQFDQLFPLAEQDTAGSDLVDGARPGQAVRFIAAQALGSAHALTAYRSAQPAAAALSDYGAQLRTKGFAELDWQGLARESGPVDFGPGVFSATFKRGDQTLIATSKEDGSGSLMSVVQLANLPVPKPWEMDHE